MRKRLTVEGKETKIIVVETIVAIDVPNKVESEKGEKKGRKERERGLHCNVLLHKILALEACVYKQKQRVQARGRHWKEKEEKK